MWRARTQEVMVVAVLFGLLTVLFSWPLAKHAGSAVLSDSPDSRLFIWTLGWDIHAFLHAPLGIFDANIYFPQAKTLAYSENLIGAAILGAPVWWTTGNPVLTLNVVSLVSAWLGALGAYVLARQLGASREAALLAGLGYGFAPLRFLRLYQLHLTTLHWIPWALAALHRYLDGGGAWALRLAIFFATFQAITSGHGAIFVGLACAGLIAYRLACGEPLALRSRARDLGWQGALLALPVALVFLPYLEVQRDIGLRRTLDNWAISAASFLASPSHLHQRVLSWFGAAHLIDSADAYLFPGYLPIALGLVGLWVAGRSVSARSGASVRDRLRRDPLPPYLLLTLLTVWLSVGARWSLWPLVYWMPGLNFIRVPSRFMLLATLGLALVGAGAFDRVASRWRSGRRRVVGLLLAMGMCAEFAVMPLGVDPLSVDAPAIDRWLAAQPGRFAIAEVPLGNPSNLGQWERRHTLYMLHSMAHWQKTVEGYSGIRTRLHEQLYDLLTRFPDDASVSKLAELGVSRVVVHADYYDSAEQWRDVSARLDRTPRLELEHREGDGYVYRLRNR